MLVWQGDVAAPPPDAAYLESLKEKVVQAAAAAKASAQPAELAWTTAQIDGVGCNRHSPDGATDPEVGLLVIRAATDKSPIAMASIYGMHPTVLHKELAPGQSFPVAFTEGELQGYIVTPEAAAAGGYEAAGAVFAPATGEEMVKGARQALQQLGLI